MPGPLFSVLMASFNNGRYLEEAIESVRSQTYPNWEIIIVDDGSTDCSAECYARYEADERVHIHYNRENKGCGYSKRRCVELAHGLVCGFLDADDALLPEALDIMVRAHMDHPEASAVLSRHYNCDEGMNVLSVSRRLEIPQGKDYFTNHDYLPEHFTSFKKSAYDKSKGIDADKPLGVDEDLIFSLEEVAPCIAISDITYKYRQSRDGISRGSNEDNALIWNVIVRYETCLRRNLPVQRYAVEPALSILGAMRERCSDEICRIRSGVTFRIGSVFTRPLIAIRNHFWK